MNTLTAISPLIGATSFAQNIAGEHNAPSARNWFGTGDDSRLGLLHVGSDSQLRSIDVIEQDFVRALLEPQAHWPE